MLMSSVSIHSDRAVHAIPRGARVTDPTDCGKARLCAPLFQELLQELPVGPPLTYEYMRALTSMTRSFPSHCDSFGPTPAAQLAKQTTCKLIL
jgi:hypothetical protein